jgi:hypothetical protein
MMVILLARINASMKEHMQEMTARMDANQAEMKADRKADQPRTEANKEDMLAEISARMGVNTKDIESSQAKMRSTVCTVRSELEDTIQRETRAAIKCVRSELDEKTACNGATETEPDPGIMQSIEEHQGIPKEDAAVMPIGGLRKRRMVQNLAAERRQKRKEITRGNNTSRRTSVAACREVSRRAKVAWRKRKLVRRIGTQENCRPRKEFSPTGIRMTHSAKVTRGKEHGLQRQVKDNSAPRTPTGRTSRMKRWIILE